MADKQNARKHGAYSYRDHGEQALETTQKSMLVELREQCSSRAELISVLTDQVVDAVVITRILKDHVIKQVQSGRQIENITALKALGTYQNSAMRGISLLLSVLPKEGEFIDLDELRERYEGTTDGSESSVDSA